MINCYSVKVTEALNVSEYDKLPKIDYFLFFCITEIHCVLSGPLLEPKFTSTQMT